ncbi:MAG: acyltransferase domain-containing protein [Clostridiales bacterium]|nr:acyltransferase domain-containing protein [Clostridiales bacterium]
MEVSIFKYADPQPFGDLCEALHMPRDLTSRLLRDFTLLNFETIAPWFPGLFSLENGEESVKMIPELCKTADDITGDSGLKALTVYLIAALHTKELYTELGIPEDIFLDTIKALPRFSREHRDSYGRFGFDRHFWIYRQLSANLFRLGTLEFELCRLPENVAPVGPAAAGDQVLSVHIPSDAQITREALNASYSMAGEFLARFFPNFYCKCVYCDTWLLSPVLREILKPGSRILMFRNDYVITKIDMTVNSGLNWVFKRYYSDFTQLPEDTSLMRGMKKILLSGGKTGSAVGYVRDFHTFPPPC